MAQIGWNIEGGDLGERRDFMREQLKRHTSNWHLLLGDIYLAMELLPYVKKGIVYRVFDPFNEHAGDGSFDNSFWLRHSPQEIVDYLKATHSQYLGNDKIVWSVGNNEPGTVGRTAEFVKWCVDLMELGWKEKIRFAVAEIAVAKSVWHDEVKAGVWDDFIYTASKYRGYHLVTFHEYTTGILPATFLPDYPLNLNNPELLAPENWQQATMNLETIDANWHLGRGALVTNVRARQLGVEPIPFVVTECAFDWMADIVSTPDRASVLNDLKARYKVDGYDFMRGSSGHRKYHEWLMEKAGYTETWNDYLYDQLVWLVNAYPKECEGFTIFALNRDWDKPEGHDMSMYFYDVLRKRLVDYPIYKGEENVADIEWNMQDKVVYVTSGYLNVRIGMSTDDTIVGRIEEDAKQMSISEHVEEKNGYTWHRVHTPEFTGFVAKLSKLVIEDIPVVDPEPTPDPDEPDNMATAGALITVIVAALIALANLFGVDFYATVPTQTSTPTAEISDTPDVDPTPTQETGFGS